MYICTTFHYLIFMAERNTHPFTTSCTSMNYATLKFNYYIERNDYYKMTEQLLLCTAQKKRETNYYWVFP